MLPVRPKIDMYIMVSGGVLGVLVGLAFITSVVNHFWKTGDILVWEAIIGVCTLLTFAYPVLAVLVMNRRR